MNLFYCQPSFRMVSYLVQVRSVFKFALVLWRDLLSNEWIVEESVALCKLSIPMTRRSLINIIFFHIWTADKVLTLFLEYLMVWMSLIFTGHLPEGNISLAYSSAGLGSSFVNMTGLAITDGLCSAADTLCSQAYGYKSYKRVGVILQRGVLIVLLGVFPVWALSLNTEPILLILQQPPCVAKYAAKYVFIFSLSLPAFVIYSLLRYYLQAQGIVWQLVWIGLLSNVASVLLHFVFIFILKLGFVGAVWALTLSNIVLVLFVLGYMYIRQQNPVTWEGWGFECLFEWGQYIHLAVPGLVLLFLDWFTIEVINLVAGWLGEKELAANTVMTQTTFMLSILSVGISMAVSVRVGNTLGEGNPVRAKRIACVAMVIGVAVGTVYVVLMLCVKDVITSLYITGDDEVNKIVQKIMPVTTFFIFFEQLQLILCGVLLGCGRQNIGAAVIFVSDYIIGLPFGMLLVFKTSMGIQAMWIGMFIGTIFQLMVLGRILLTIDWNEVSKEAISKIEADMLVTNSRRETRENGIGLHSEHKDQETEHQENQDPDHQHKSLDGLTDLKDDRNSFFTSEHKKQYSNYVAALRFRLGRCIGLYAVGIVMVMVGYGIHWFRESNRTNRSCEI